MSGAVDNVSNRESLVVTKAAGITGGARTLCSMSPRTPEQRAVEDQTRRERDAAIREAWLDGDRTEDIARRHGLSIQRVGHIIDIPHHQAERQARQEQRDARDTDRAHAWSRANPGVSLSAGAAALSMTPQRLRALLGHRLCLHQHPATGDAAPPRVVRQTRPQWIQEELLEWVRRYFCTTPGPWSLTDLDAWLQQQDGAPSIGLVRSRVGRWSVLVRHCAGDTLK